VTSLTSVALKVGANRVVRGARFSHPCGSPSLAPEAEHAFRVALVREALEALRTSVDGPTLFEKVTTTG
jgi:glycine/betaine/sarcosine/D-proline reductase family selenoprotein B